MLFEWIKILHIFSASILFGTGVGTALYMLAANLTKDNETIALATQRVVIADGWFTGISGTLQPVTGFYMLALMHFQFNHRWVFIVTSGYLIAGVCWIIVAYLQIKCRDLAMAAWKNKHALGKTYYRYFRAWILLGIPAFAALMVVFYFMANSPLQTQ